MFSLSNLSAAASAEFEFMLNFNSNNENNKDRIDNESFKNLNKTNLSSMKQNDSIKQKHYSETNDFSKYNNNKKVDQIELNNIKKEIPKYDSLKMNTDQGVALFNAPSDPPFHKSSLNRDINYKFSVLDQQNILNKRSKASSINGDEFGLTNPSGTGGNSQNWSDCGKTFTNKSALAKHRLIHSNERKYACHLCDKSFKRQDHLNSHLLTHQDKKPFECKAPGCDKRYYLLHKLIIYHSFKNF